VDFDASTMFYRSRIGLRTGLHQSISWIPAGDVVNPPAHKVFEPLVSFYLDQAAKQ
jgi:hypothetical protein